MKGSIMDKHLVIFYLPKKKFLNFDFCGTKGWDCQPLRAPLTVPAGPIKRSDSLLQRKWHWQDSSKPRHHTHTQVQLHRHARSHAHAQNASGDEASVQLDFREFCDMCVSTKRQNAPMCHLSDDGTLRLRAIPPLSTKYNLLPLKRLVLCVGATEMWLISPLARSQTQPDGPLRSCRLIFGFMWWKIQTLHPLKAQLLLPWWTRAGEQMLRLRFRRWQKGTNTNN